MYLKELTIHGYKCFLSQFEITFSKGLNVIVGENASGKTAIIDTIRLLLQEDEFGRSPISDTDFHRPFKKPLAQADSFRLCGKFSELSPKETVAYLPWTDLDGQAMLTLHAKNKPTRGRFKRKLWGGASLASMFEWELFDTINCIYLPPLRDAEAKLREGKSSRLARLLKNLNRKRLDDAKQAKELHPLEASVKEFNEKLAQDEGQAISEANKLIKARLKEALGTVFGQDTHIQFSEANFNRIAESLRLLFFPRINSNTTQDMFRSLEENSLGYNNLLYLATVLAELTDDSDSSTYFKVLLIEEPEAHLHPQLQIRLLKYLEATTKNKDVQVIVTTHSPVLASSVSLNSMIHLTEVKGEPRATSLNKCGLGLEDGSYNYVNRWLDVTKSTLLFAKGIILVEGIAEAMLLPVMARLVLTKWNAELSGESTLLPISLEDGGISVVNMNGIYFKHFMQLSANLNNEGSNIPIRCSGITDNDPPKDSMPTPSNLVPGNNHALKLIDQVNTSEWCRLYVNELKTFEYDLAFEGSNAGIMAAILAEMWTKDGAVKPELEKLSKHDWSKADEAEKKDAAGNILKRIEDAQIGKGAFSQTLADRLEVNPEGFSVPSYIKKAVIWACGGEPHND